MPRAALVRNQGQGVSHRSVEVFWPELNSSRSGILAVWVRPDAEMPCAVEPLSVQFDTSGEERIESREEEQASKAER